MQASKRLLEWYQDNQRDLPWRQNGDPYRILVSEIMLQQTRVETVIPKYIRFIERFPDCQSLADATIEEVFQYWEGLGYYRRARNLKTACEEILKQDKGNFPRTKNDLLKLSGVGDYTASAVASIAFDEGVVVLDGNVKRVAARFFNIQSDLNRAKVKREIKRLLEDNLFKSEDASNSNQSLMELGALICTPKSPECDVCPIKMDCQARKAGIQDKIPLPKIKKPPIQKFLYFYLGVQGTELCLTTKTWKNYQQGFLNMPFLESDTVLVDHEISRRFRKEWDINLSKSCLKLEFSHSITKYKLNCFTLVDNNSLVFLDQISGPKTSFLNKTLKKLL